MRSSIEYFIARIKAKTPPFFKKVRALAITMGSIGAALMVAKMQYDMVWLPEKYVEWLIVAGVVGAALAQTTAEKPPKSNDTQT